MTFKRDKYTKLLAYLICACCDKRHIGKTVLSNLLYFIDFNYYELYQKSLTNEKYFKTKKGIEPEHFKEITEELVKKDCVFHRKEEYYNTTLNRYYITKIPNVNFNLKELEVINSAIYNLSDFNATEIYKYSCNDMPYKLAGLNDEINYTNAFNRTSEYSAYNILNKDYDFLLKEENKVESMKDEIKRLEASIKDERKKLEYPKRKNKRIMENAFSNTRNVSPVITKSEIKSYY